MDRTWAENGCLYGISKTIDHPRAVHQSSIVRMDTFYSMWRRCAANLLCPQKCHGQLSLAAGYRLSMQALAGCAATKHASQASGSASSWAP